MDKKRSIKFLYLFAILQVYGTNIVAQITVSGNVYDSSKLYAVPEVSVYSTGGATAISDSIGFYQIKVSANDSLSFYYQGKSTVKFPVREIKNYSDFDISLRVQARQKYKLLNPVTVFLNSYQQDSIENRGNYSNIFGNEKPGIHSTYDPGGAAGLDLDALIGMFQFRKNKQNLAFKQRLIEQEQDQYIDYRFSSKTITRITGLTGDSLQVYKKVYRPNYYFVTSSTTAEFYSYILNTSYAFRKRQPVD